MTTPDAGPATTSWPPPEASAAAPAWQALPTRARLLFLLGNLASFGAAAVAALVPIGLLLPWDGLKLPLSLAVLAGLPGFGAWLAIKQFRRTHWRLDSAGFGLRRGRMWRQETRVPASRVQHLDLRRGPLERRLGLATLVIHTAGTRHSAVTVRGLDAADAERLRDRLGHQIDHDDVDD
jgi:uncharacterized protein